MDILSVVFTPAVATPMYCSANVQNFQPIATKVHEAIQESFYRRCKSESCKKNIQPFVASLPLYPVVINLEDLTFEKIPYVEQYHTSICYELAKGETPACDQLFAHIDQPNLLENELNINFSRSKLKIKELHNFKGRTKRENWLVADLSPVHLAEGATLRLHISIFVTKDIDFLKETKEILTKTLSGVEIKIGEIACRMGKY